jgi:hypothetical protein
MKRYSFNPEIAKVFGLESAILENDLAYRAQTEGAIKGTHVQFSIPYQFFANKHDEIFGIDTREILKSLGEQHKLISIRFETLNNQEYVCVDMDEAWLSARENF